MQVALALLFSFCLSALSAEELLPEDMRQSDDVSTSEMLEAVSQMIKSVDFAAPAISLGSTKVRCLTLSASFALTHCWPEHTTTNEQQVRAAAREGGDPAKARKKGNTETKKEGIKLLHIMLITCC